MTAITLHCAHQPLADQVRSWLAGAQLPVRNAELTITLGGLSAPTPDDRAVFRQGRVAIRGATAAHPSIVLEWGNGLGRATIDPHRPSAHVELTAQALEQGHELYRSFLLNVCILLLRKAGLHHVHGATLIDPTSRGWLLAGTSGSGKSTTTALLARAGWLVGTDDIAFLSRSPAAGQVDVHAWRDHVALRDDAATTIAAGGGESLGTRRKTGFMPEQLGVAWAPCVTPSLLAFTRIDAAHDTSMTRISARDAFERLMHNSAWVMLDATVADAHLALMTQLATQAASYELTLGRDMFAHPERLLELAA